MNSRLPARSDVFLPDITVACVVRRDDRFLMVEERVRGALVINQPAGHLEPGESLIDAAVRETLEETRWEVELTGLVGVYQWQAPDQTHFLRFAFAAVARREHLERDLDHGIVQPLWLSRSDLIERTPSLRSPLVLRAVDDALNGSTHPLDLLRHVG